MMDFPSIPHPKPVTPLLTSPDVLANHTPAKVPPTYGMIGEDTLMVMHIVGIGYIVMRTHEETAGMAIFTEGEVSNFDGY